MAGNLGVDDRQLRDPRRIRERRQPRHGGAGVVREQRAAIDPELGKQGGHPARLRRELEIRAIGPTAVAESGKVEDEAGALLRELRKQRAPGVAVHREAVDQHERGAVPETPHRQGGVLHRVETQLGGRVERFGRHRFRHSCRVMRENPGEPSIRSNSASARSSTTAKPALSYARCAGRLPIRQEICARR